MVLINFGFIFGIH